MVEREVCGSRNVCLCKLDAHACVCGYGERMQACMEELAASKKNLRKACEVAFCMPPFFWDSKNRGQSRGGGVGGVREERLGWRVGLEKLLGACACVGFKMRWMVW